MKTTPRRDWMLMGALLGGTTLFPLGCETSTGEPSTGSESHFLKSCESDEDCGTLSCLCSVCSRACDDAVSCTGLAAAAECVANSTRPPASACPSPPEAMCDLRCETSADCSTLGVGLECSHGFCRAAASTTAGSAGGSGGAALGSDIAEDGRIELDELCAMYQDSVCTKQLECESDPGFCDETHCRAALGCGEFEALRASIERGQLGFDPAAANDCYASILADPCDFSYGLIVFGMPGLHTLLNACPGVLQPQQAVGDECYGDEACMFGTHCDRDLSCPGTCVIDDPPKGAAGDACTPVLGPEQNCVQPLVCLLPASTESGEQECGEAPSAGDPCEAASQCRCNGPEALCQSLGCDLSLGECVPLSEVGEACSTLDATGVPDCLAPAWCDGGFDGGICRPPSGDGGPCSSFTDCQAPLTCIDAVCVPAVGPGEVCTFGGDCIRGDCVDEVCVPLGATGAACEVDGDCAMGLLCFDGACRPFSCPGAACNEATPCLEGRCVSGGCVRWARPGDECGSDADCNAGPTSGELVCADNACRPASECW